MTANDNTHDHDIKIKGGSFSLSDLGLLMPGMAEIMPLVGARIWKCYYAGQAKNKPLAAFQLKEAVGLMEKGGVLRPKYAEDIKKIIQQLDQRKNMVGIQVLIAEVRLGDIEQFGIEIGIQDSLLFDRGLGPIGFPFNQAGLGNSTSGASLATRNAAAAQCGQSTNRRTVEAAAPDQFLVEVAQARTGPIWRSWWDAWKQQHP